jgi:hypothetical protein
VFGWSQPLGRSRTAASDFTRNEEQNNRGQREGWAHMSKSSLGAYRPVRRRARQLIRRWATQLLSLLQVPVLRIERARTIRRSAEGSIDPARSWRRRRSGVTVLEILSYLGAVALGVVVVWSFIVMLLGLGVLSSVNDRCGRYSAACNASVGFLIPLLSVAAASAIFLFYRLRYVTSPIVKEARSRPQDLVETATPNTGNIVGRSDLCQVIMEGIRHRDIRRPHIVVGGVGTGKTAVLVHLTKLLAEHSAIPVPIRLRDAQDGLNFREMAYKRFQSMAEDRFLSTGEAEKVWRQLCRDDKVVVIADGLEEALSAQPDRDNLIRLAIRRARELGLPLIIASRPHEPLGDVDATIMELEPLSEDAAAEYIAPDNENVDGRWLDWIVETAGLTELPLYLQITRQLYQRDRLDYLSTDRSAKVDLRNLDRSELQLYLLNTWMQALFDGHLREAVPLNRRQREAAVEWLSALACLGLKADTLDVKFDDYYKGNKADERDASQSPKYKEIDDKIQLFVKDKLSPRHLDIRLAVTWGDQLQLVEACGDGLRFRHSIMQAYLGSRFMSTALEDDEFLKDAENKLRDPGQEFLIALVLHSRSAAADQMELAGQSESIRAGQGASPTSAVARGDGELSGPTSADAPMAPTANAAVASGVEPSRASVPTDGEAAAPASPTSELAQAATTSTLRGAVESIPDTLAEAAAAATNDVKKLDLYAVALEIDSFVERSRYQEIAKEVASSWRNIRGGDQRTLDEAKLRLVFRFGDAVRTIADRSGRHKSSVNPAYQELFEMGRGEQSFPIRLAIAQEIGAGGDAAFEALHKSSEDSRYCLWEKTAWLDEIKNAEPGTKLSDNERNETRKRTRRDNQPGNADKNRALRGRTLCAWLTPLLVGSVNECRDEARQELGLWLDRVGRDQEGGGNYFPLSLEVALAQGFKYAANRRVHHPHALPATRDYLAEQAMEMLKRARFWFTQLTLIHALCLWEMPDPSMSRDDKTGRRGNGNSAAESRARRHGSNPEATVEHWLEVARIGKHPFVAEAGKLAVEALKTGHPDRFVWIDENGIVSSVGSRAVQATKDRKHQLWIPPSAGWPALDPRAQQLVADVLLLLNLAERGEGPDEIEQRLRRVESSDLPPCFTRNRDPLNPKTTVGGLYRAPGSNCIDGCRHRLCPYPPYGVQLYHSELSEAFCRRQQTLLSRGLTAPWQTIPRADLKRFWAQMADRARGGSADQDRD